MKIVLSLDKSFRAPTLHFNQNPIFQRVKVEIDGALHGHTYVAAHYS